MACDFCRSTPVKPCPVCEVAHAATPKAIRSPKSKAKPAPLPPSRRVTPPAVSGYQFSTDPEVARLRAVAIVVPVPTLKPRPALVGWHADAAFTLGILNRKALPGCVVDSTCRPTDDRTQVARVGLNHGDWAGMARAVEAGWMTDAEAIELAQTWRMGVAS